MTFISYAQNFEDVMLWRALNQIKDGFYVDAGANDPEIESVTKAFYDYGWHGVNIEPVSSHFEALLKLRPRDINLLCAIGQKKGEINIFESDVRGWATGVPNVAKRQIREGHEGKYHSVQLRTLADICREFVEGDIHFLKIDVEGMEKEALLGADLENFRPWIIVVEATNPNSTKEVHCEWEPLLFNRNYVFSYADGLNRFYVAKERSRLAELLKYPPNIFDDFMCVDQLNANIKAKQLENVAYEAEMRAIQADVKIQELESKVNASKKRAEQAEAVAQEIKKRLQIAEKKAQKDQAHSEYLQMELRNIYESRLWKMTAPWRCAGNMARLFKRKIFALATFVPGGQIKHALRGVLLTIKHVLSMHPLSKSIAIQVLHLFPKLETRFRVIGRYNFQYYDLNQKMIKNHAKRVNELSPMAREIYFDLKAALEKEHKEQS
jgi:FkbM family methyltransferase